MSIHDLYRSVTLDIIAQLEAGVAPWTQAWKEGGAAPAIPRNAVTGREYRGINIPILWRATGRHAYPSHEWATYRQAHAAGGQVRKGERGTAVVLVKRFDDETSAESRYPRPSLLLRQFIVFNLAQIEGLETRQEAVSCPPLPFAMATGAEIRDGDRPMYIPSRDYILMPPAGRFIESHHYHATLLHELVHWSGAKQRLDRDLSGRFGTAAYAAEELVAELGAAFLCAHLGVKGELRHAEYIGSWIALLRDDSRALFTAASKASQAADFLRSFSEDLSPDNSPTLAA